MVRNCGGGSGGGGNAGGGGSGHCGSREHLTSAVHFVVAVVGMTRWAMVANRGGRVGQGSGRAGGGWVDRLVGGRWLKKLIVHRDIRELKRIVIASSGSNVACHCDEHQCKQMLMQSAEHALARNVFFS